MNRKIIFRAKRDLYEEWIYGSLLRVDGSTYIVQNDDVEKDGHHLVFITDIPMLVEEDTIGQFTGLYDKNGKACTDNFLLGFKKGADWAKEQLKENNNE